MPKCRLSPTHNRVRKKGENHFTGNRHKQGIRGCQWKGTGSNRVCARCGDAGRSPYPGYTKEDRGVKHGA